jgi:hypothetical protein
VKIKQKGNALRLLLYLLYEERGSKSVFVGPITLINMHGNTEIVSITISIPKRGRIPEH